MFNVKIQPNGELLLTADNETRAYIADEMRNGQRGNCWYELFEPYYTNGEYQPFEPGDGSPHSGPFVGLTSAPCIAESMDYLDDGTQEIVGRLWYFADYMIRDELEELKNRGRVTFQLAA